VAAAAASTAAAAEDVALPDGAQDSGAHWPSRCNTAVVL
jgi:hypothetical protein